MKLCKNCRYHYDKHMTIWGLLKASFWNFETLEPFCTHPKSVKYVDYVDGDMEYLRCNTMRITGECGDDAKLFESKEQKDGQKA